MNMSVLNEKLMYDGLMDLFDSESEFNDDNIYLGFVIEK